MNCPVCNHSKRAEIEEHLLTYQYGGDVQCDALSLDDLAGKYKLRAVELQVHLLMHTSLSQEERGITGSLVEDIKKREADLLSRAAEDYFQTLKAFGSRLRMAITPIKGFEEEQTIKPLSKEMVDTYIGSGENLRKIMSTISDMDARINSSDDKGLSALASVVTAIRGSAPGQPMYTQGAKKSD